MKDIEGINPNYNYPDDIYKTLIWNPRLRKWEYLGTLLRQMTRQRQDKKMMSNANYRKNYGFNLVIEKLLRRCRD